MKASIVPFPEQEKLEDENAKKADENYKCFVGFSDKSYNAIKELKEAIPTLPRLSTAATKAIHTLVASLEKSYTEWRDDVLNLGAFMPAHHIAFNDAYRRVSTTFISSCKIAIDDAMPILKQNLSYSDQFMNILRTIGNLFITMANSIKTFASNVNTPYTLYQPIVVAGADKVERAKASLFSENENQGSTQP